MIGWQALGTVGAAFVVLAYWMLTTFRWKSTDPKFYAVNLTGGILLYISLCFNFNLGSMLIEIFWICISVKGLLRAKVA